MTTPTAAPVPDTRRAAIRWFLTWSAVFGAAQAIAVTADVILRAVDAFGRTTQNHREPSFDGALGDGIGALWGAVVLQAPLLALALTVLCLVGRKLGPVRFRLLSLLMFFWYAPLWPIFWGGGFALETWAVAQLVVALAIRAPTPVRDGQPHD
jgi:hypothetical protein